MRLHVDHIFARYQKVGTEQEDMWYIFSAGMHCVYHEVVVPQGRESLSVFSVEAAPEVQQLVIVQLPSRDEMPPLGCLLGLLSTSSANVGFCFRSLPVLQMPPRSSSPFHCSPSKLVCFETCKHSEVCRQSSVLLSSFFCSAPANLWTRKRYSHPYLSPEMVFLQAHPEFLKKLVELVRSGSYLPAANTRLEDWAQPDGKQTDSSILPIRSFCGRYWSLGAMWSCGRQVGLFADGLSKLEIVFRLSRRL
jgi:hypothetical protein